ncbi:hypothetical protein B0I35DRAFT_153685 [Stachybotrys elegans]|uniref:Carrier domain-containing protein n=1 Tax=Stachybotrys elegans TaxID=80388 RepID=A0A8K0S9H0_9HYPO|nr:hypothetical protein B0I35DRAFT_153685 [Stachybotrys elegans]
MVSITTSALRTTDNLWPNAIKSRLGKPYAVIVSPDGQLESFGFADLENASNRAAWFLEENCKDGMFFYMGPSDLRYMVWVLAAMKTGKCVVFPSPGNSVPANRKLFTTVGAKKFLFAVEFTAMSAPLRAATEDLVQSCAAPAFAELMDKHEARVYPFDKTWDEVKHTRFMALHTSGTSGHPKPIYWNHMGVSVLGAFLDDEFVGPNGTNLSRDLFVGTRILMPFPLFHMGGMASVLASVFSENTIVLPKSGTPLSPPNYTALLQHAECTATFAPPAVLEGLLAFPPGLAALSKLDHVAYTGGPLQPTRGAELAKHVKHLFPILASTEGGAAILESTGDSSHWDSFKFIDVGQRMQETTPGFYELVFPRAERVDKSYGFFHVYPDLKKEYRTSDLLSPVPGEEGWWVYRGRADNWVVMTNGLKMDPTDTENAVLVHSKVKGILVAGSHRFRPCMLVELNEDEQDEAAVMQDIWHLVVEANGNAPKFGRVPRELIMMAKKDKPFLRASKGTVQRQLTIAAYQDEIDELYSQVEDGLLSTGLLPITSTKAEDLVPFLADLVQQTLEVGDKAVGPDDDLIALGLDSLLAFILLARLKAALREYGARQDQLDSVTPKLIYSSTTVRKIAEHLAVLLDGSSGKDSLGAKDFEELLAKYTPTIINLAKSAPAVAHQEARGQQTVVLTGSTGSLGTYILAALLANPAVHRVVCLNRDTPPTAQARQETSLQDRGLPPLVISRVTFIQARLDQPNLGLSTADYATLVETTTCVIHNAFPVNWLMGVASFEPQIRGLVGLLALVQAGPKHPDFFFASSIAAATPILAPQSPSKMPEAIMSPDDAVKLLLPQGYAQAKYICERLLQIYSSEALQSRRIGVLRIGQICGPVGSANGTWNPSEWLPSLVISSARFLGALPESLGPSMTDDINWLPVDELAKMIVELLGAPATDGLVVYNMVHPQPTSWQSLLPALDGIVPRRVPLAEWVRSIERAGARDDLANLHRNPALKLIDFYKQTLLAEGGRSALVIDSDNLLKASETARSLVPITKDNLASWAESWGL